MSIKDIFPIEKWDFNSESILADLPEEDLKQLTRNQSIQTYSKGEIIFREKSFASGIFYLLKGMVKKFKLDKEGHEQIIYVAKRGELIGYHAVLSGDRYPDSAAALEESKIAFIPREDFLAAVQNSSVLSKRLLKTLSHEFTVFVNSISMFAQRSVRERLALQLILLREKSKVDFHPGMSVEINWSREDLASLVGTARENLVRILTEFKEEGILEIKGRKIIVRNLEKLMEMSNSA
ncbi:MAG: Crp/Fnr family transcriptional regulator [Bacteroidetes bacterium]|nr:MAG: Crp/Fnr family transcriptional regulator [Bacteroidota bacterium]